MKGLLLVLMLGFSSAAFGQKVVGGMRLSGTVRDQLVVLYHFDERGSRLGRPPAARLKH